MASTQALTFTDAGVRTNNELQDKIQKKWTDVEKKLREMVPKGTEVAKLAANTDIYAARKDLEDYLKREMTDKDSEALKKVLGHLGIVWQAAKTFGDAIANGVSIVFAPAPTCFTALVVIVDGLQKFPTYMDNLMDVLGKCAGFFGRLQDRVATEIEEKICDVVLEQLDIFAEVCQQCWKLKSDRKARVKKRMELFFMKDETISGLLKDMETLADNETKLDVIQMKKLISNLAYKRAQKATEESWRKTIIKTLGFDENELIDAQEPRRISLGKQNDKVTLKGTGAWIDKNEQFIDWKASELKEGVKPVLLLQGEPGHGKTFALTHMVQKLRRLETRKTVISYSGAAPRTSPSQAPLHSYQDNRHDLLRFARSVIWQCAEAHKLLRKFMANFIEMNREIRENPGDVSGLWRKPVIDNEKRKKMDEVIFVIVDSRHNNCPWTLNITP